MAAGSMRLAAQTLRLFLPTLEWVSEKRSQRHPTGISRPDVQVGVIFICHVNVLLSCHVVSHIEMSRRRHPPLSPVHLFVCDDLLLAQQW